MVKKSRLIIVEDHTLLRVGLITMIATDPSIEVVGEAANGQEAVRQAIDLKPDLILMDINMPIMNGTEALIDIKKRNPNIKVLMLTAHNAEEYIRECLRVGADGYVLKSASREELMTAIHKVLGGRTFLSPDVEEQIVHRYLGGGGDKANVSGWETLSKREREVLKLVAEGNSNKSISNIMFISIKTVEKHRSNLMRKLNLHNTSDVTNYAISKGIVVSR